MNAERGYKDQAVEYTLFGRIVRKEYTFAVSGYTQLSKIEKGGYTFAAAAYTLMDKIADDG